MVGFVVVVMAASCGGSEGGDGVCDFGGRWCKGWWGVVFRVVLL